MRGLALDAGALIGVERGDERVRSLLRAALEQGRDVHVVAGVVAQVWRDGARQARLARTLDADGVTTPSLDAQTARAVGRLCGVTGHSDVVDVHLALHARLHDLAVVTSDVDDLRLVDPTLPLIPI
ncbi:MAG TPA: PIN domain-containing protein [Nocardioides sp.]|nr:PIN domain-containing protein [Nocardioides sp.]